eukprot:1190955-Prorocentrum_minimum.AAC.6
MPSRHADATRAPPGGPPGARQVAARKLVMMSARVSYELISVGGVWEDLALTADVVDILGAPPTGPAGPRPPLPSSHLVTFWSPLVTLGRAGGHPGSAAGAPRAGFAGPGPPLRGAALRPLGCHTHRPGGHRDDPAGRARGPRGRPRQPPRRQW